MQGERIVLDGLWRCLCPSVDAATLTKILRRPAAPSRRAPAIRCRNIATEAYARRSTESLGRVWRPQPLRDTKKEAGAKRRGDSRWSALTTTTPQDADEKHWLHVHRIWKRFPELPLSFFDGQVSSWETLDGIRTEAIIEGLRELVFFEHQYLEICNIVRYLVTQRNRKADAFLYRCLIRANIDPHHGSARVVADMLEEMASKGIMATPAIFKGVLDVLCVHPDYVLRNKIVEQMRASWNPPKFEGHVSIALGLLRDGQHEMALDKLEQLKKTGVEVPFWLYDIFIFHLGGHGVHDETLMIMQHRLRDTKAAIPHNLWLFLLDVFSGDAYYEGIKYIWNRVVAQGKLVPSDGVAVNILNAASRAGDAVMAMEVIGYLSNRGVKLGMHHFEALLEIQARNNDLSRAFSTMCLMVKAGLHPDRSSARPISLQLHGSNELTKWAVSVLDGLRRKNEVPIAAFNAVMEATLLHRDFKIGLGMYRTVQRICAGGPNIETFKILLQHCTLDRSMRFLLAEMEQFSIEPDEEAYDRIVYISTLSSKYEPAFRYLEKMRASKTDGQANDWWISRKTSLSLLRRAILAEDARTQDLIEECKKRNVIVGSDLEALLRAAQQRRQAGEERPASAAVADAHIPQDAEIEQPVQSATGAA